MRNFGIEIELAGITTYASVDALKNAGINARYEGYNHDDHADGVWKVVTDGSVSHGHEVVSPILHGEEGLKQAMHAANALEEAGAIINKTCGLHVHFNATDLTVEEIRMICKRYMAHEKEIDAFMPKSRRENNNTFCKSTSICFERNSQFEKATTIIALARSVLGRYYKVNLQSYLVHHTIEFRQHSGTVDAQKIANWVRFLDGFINESIKMAHAETESVRLQPAQKNLLDLIKTDGMDTENLMARLNIQAHSLRGAISILRKKGLDIVSHRENGSTYYKYNAKDEAQIEDKLFNGIDPTIADFYAARAMALAA
jgi:hypothetical protein